MAQANGSGNTTTANLMVEDVKYAKRNRKNLYVSLPELQSSQLFEVFAVRDDLQVRSAERSWRKKNPAADLVRGAPVGSDQGASQSHSGGQQRLRVREACVRDNFRDTAALVDLVRLIWRVKVKEHALLSGAVEAET